MPPSDFPSQPDDTDTNDTDTNDTDTNDTPPDDDTAQDDSGPTIAQIRKRVIVWWAIRWGLMTAIIIFFGLQSPRSFWALAVMIPLALVSLSMSLWNIRKYEQKLAEWETPTSPPPDR